MDICPRCKNEIDPDVCWCGDTIDNHTDHSPVPMGCTCRYGKPKQKTTKLADAIRLAGGDCPTPRYGFA